jgi:hypothetical protein
MTDEEILYQMIERNINQALTMLNPSLRMFSGTMTKYTMEILDPYIKGFMNNDTGHLNSKAATAFIKEETNKKIEDFMKRFEEESKNGL